MIEGLKPRQAAKRSRQLLTGSPSGYDVVFQLFVLLALLVLLLALGFGISMSLLGLPEWIETSTRNTWIHDIATQAVDLSIWFLLVWTLVPVWCTTATILYYERRIRREGYDIEMLAQDVWRADRATRFEI